MQSKDTFTVLAIGTFIGAIIVGGAALVWNHDQPSRSPLYRTPDAPHPQRSDAPTLPTLPTLPTPGTLPALDPAVTRVASRFVCSCGTCGEERLDVCTCETAQAERAFIQDQLRNGRSETEAAEALKQKYGGLKS
jgi:hypothetical protein